MKTLLKYLGLIVIVIGAVLLIAIHFTGNVNNNGILGLGALLVIIGLVGHIIINRKIAD